MIRIANLTLARGALRLLEGASLTVHAGHRVGIVGPNGCGKSSLFALLRGELHAEAGTLDMPPRWRIAHVAQETPAVERAAIDFVLDGDVELRNVENELAQAEREHAADGLHLAELHHRYEAIGGYAARARASELLAGLGVADARHGDPVASFSGGWRMRLNLAQALAARSDLLLLDEPTNHLDLDAVLWLEDWLKRYPGTLLLVTHDRDFLDAVAQTIVHVTGRKLESYSGNYSAFELARAGQLALQQSAYAKQQRQIAHLQSFVDRFRAKATKASRRRAGCARSRRWSGSPRRTSTARSSSSSRRRARTRDSSYASNTPRCATATRRRCSKASNCRCSPATGSACLGPNGAGKSTLAKALAGTMPLARGERHIAQNLAIGYFAQHQLEQLDLEASPLLHLQRIEPGTREQVFRNFLGGFDFRGDAVTAPVTRFSGGEKARLVLAMIVRTASAAPDPRRADQPPRHRDARGARGGTAVVRRRARRRRARSPPARRDDRHAAAGQRRPGRTVRRRPR